MAVEAVVLTASKKDKASGMLSLGLDVLKKLYNSTNKKIKVRALVVSVSIKLALIIFLNGLFKFNRVCANLHQAKAMTLALNFWLRVQF